MYKYLFIFLTFTCSLSAKPWFERKAEGWAWYEDKKEEKKVSPKKQSSAQILAKAKHELEEKLADAILNPTQDNIVAYLKLQREWLARSSTFSKEIEKALLQLPHLDPTAQEFPVSHYGRQVAKKISNEKKRERISELSRNYGMLFFYNGDDKISQAVSPIVQDFGKKYHWDIVGVSCDGTLLDGFAKNKFDNGITKQFGVEAYPSLFAVTPKTKEAVPIAYGLSTIDKIENNLILQLSKDKETL